MARDSLAAACSTRRAIAGDRTHLAALLAEARGRAARDVDHGRLLVPLAQLGFEKVGLEALQGHPAAGDLRAADFQKFSAAAAAYIGKTRELTARYTAMATPGTLREASARVLTRGVLFGLSAVGAPAIEPQRRRDGARLGPEDRGLRRLLPAGGDAAGDQESGIVTRSVPESNRLVEPNSPDQLVKSGTIFPFQLASYDTMSFLLVWLEGQVCCSGAADRLKLMAPRGQCPSAAQLLSRPV